MDMTGEFRIPAPREAVWKALNDPEILKQCIAGCEELQKTSDTEFVAKVTARVGPVKASFTGKVTLSDLDPPNGYKISGEYAAANDWSNHNVYAPIAGTTRDSIDEVIQYKGRKIRFIDTAGIRRKGKTKLMAEKLSVVMARKNIEDADIVLFMVDATEGASGLDANIAGYAHESGRSVIILVNKWDLVASGEKRAVSQSKTARIQDAKRPQDRALYEERLRYGLKFLAYAPVLFLSAHTGKGTEKILPLIETVAAERRKRISTGEMNRFLKKVDFERASVPVSKRVRIYYLTQAGVAPPTFVLFTDRAVKLHFSYQRFLENQIRDAFRFIGSPIWIKNRARG